MPDGQQSEICQRCYLNWKAMTSVHGFIWSSGSLLVLNGQVALNCILLHHKKCCCILLLPARTNIQSQFENILKESGSLFRKETKKILSPWSGKLFWSGTFTDQVSEQRLIQSGTSQGQSINNSAQTNLLLLSHIAANYTELIQDLNGVTTGTWSEQHCDAQANRKQETSHHLPNLINFFNKCYCKWWYHCRFTSWYWGEDCFWFGWQKTWWDIP